MPLLKIHTESVDHFFIVRLGFGPDVQALCNEKSEKTLNLLLIMFE